MTMRGFETVGVRAVIQGLPEYLAGAKAITSANVGISGSLKGTESITTAFKLLGAAVVSVSAAIGGAAVVGAAKYETTLTKITALTNTTAEDTAKLSKGLLQLARTVPKSPDELGAAAYFALSSGISDVDDALALVTAASKAASAGLGSTADIVDIVTAAINAYGKENLTAADATDILVAAVREGKGEPAEMATALGSLLPLAAALKIPFEDLAATFASLTNALGGRGGAEQAATQFKGIMSQIISPSKEAKNALAEATAGVKHLSQEELDLADAHRSVVSASDALASANRGVRDASEGVTQAQRGVRDATVAVDSAQRDSAAATQALRNAYADLAQAQRNQQQASLDGRRETLSVLEAEQGLVELRTQAGAHAQEVASAELAVAQAREQANSSTKRSATEQRAASLAISQAELRLNTVRAQGPRYSLDLQNAELRLQEARSRIGSAQQRQNKEVADAQKNVVKASQDVIDAGRAEVKARESLGDANKGLRNSYEGVADAQRGVTRAQADLALAMEKEVLAQIHTKDAFADLRKEIEEKGIVPALQHIQQLFADNQEGLAKLFPDIRGFIGFLSAITSQGDQTEQILARVHNRLGLTDEAFKKVSKSTEFQAKLFKNQLNVGLIQLGNVALPSVNAALGEAVRLFGPFKDALSSIGQSLPGILSGINSALSETFGQLAGGQFQSDFFGGLVSSVKDAGDAVAEFFRLFKLGLAGGDIGGEFATLQQAAFDFGVFMRETLIPAFHDAQEAVRLFFLALAGGEVGGNISDLQASFFELGATVRQQWFDVIRPAIEEGAAAIKDAFADIRPALTDFMDIVTTTARAVNDNWELIRGIFKLGLDFIVTNTKATFKIFGDQIVILSNIVQGIDDLIHGRWSDVWEDAKNIVAAAFDAIKTDIETRLLALPKLFLTTAVSIAAAAATAGASIGKAFANGIIDKINDMVQGLGGRVLIPSLNLGKLGSTPEVRVPSLGRPIPRLAKGDIVGGPTLALIGEAGPEAVLPLSDPRRSREILSSLPGPIIKNLFPSFEDGGTFGVLGWRTGFGTGAGNEWNSSLSGRYLEPITGGSGGDSGGSFSPLASRQIYGTLAPSMIRSGGGSTGGAKFDNLIGEINIGSTSREVEELTVQTVRAVFARARTGTAIGGGVISSGFG